MLVEVVVLVKWRLFQDFFCGISVRLGLVLWDSVLVHVDGYKRIMFSKMIPCLYVEQFRLCRKRKRQLGEYVSKVSKTVCNHRAEHQLASHETFIASSLEAFLNAF